MAAGRISFFLAPVALTAALSLGEERGVAGVTGAAGRASPPRPVASVATSLAPPSTSLECPAGTLPDGEICVRWRDRAGSDDDAPDAPSEVGAHRDRRGHWVVYDQIPRRPERPADYDLYRYPVPCERGCVVSGYDLDRDDALQRRGRRLSHVGHGAVDVPQPKGTPIVLVPLEHQVADADVIFVGQLFGTTVVTRHTVREAGRERDYIVLFAHLDAPAPGLHPGARLAPGDLVGTVGDTGSPELVHLHLEARRVRDGVDVTKLGPEGLVANENTVVCDPRNVLPLK